MWVAISMGVGVVVGAMVTRMGVGVRMVVGMLGIVLLWLVVGL